MKSKMHKQLRLPLMAVLLVLAGKTVAQEVILDQSFKYDGSGYPNVYTGDSRYPNWTFTNCYDVQDSYLQIGGNGNNGSVQTPTLTSLKNYAIATFVVYNYGNSERRFKIEGTDCTISRTTNYTIKGTKRNMRVTVVLSDFKNSPSLTISSMDEGSPIELKSIKVQNIGDKLFFESFDDNVATNTTNEFFYSGTETITFDNKNTAKERLFIGNQCVYSTGYYQTPTISTSNNKKYILSFRMAIAYNGVEHPTPFTVSCTGGTPSQDSFQPSNNTEWLDCKSIITSTSDNIIVKISGSGNLLDDVLITEAPTITLDQTTDNSSVITRDMNQLRTVELHRPLIKNNWNTMCLPFAVSRDIIATAIGSDANPEVRTLTSISDGVFNFAENTGTVAAGTPFLLKVIKVVTDPWTIRDVVIEQEEPLQLTFDNADGYKLAGTYSPVDLAVDGTNVFLGTDGILYSPSSDQNTMNGMRAYFIIPSGELNARVQQEESSGIATMTVMPVREAATYDLTGRRMPDDVRQPGLYTQGVRKVIVR